MQKKKGILIKIGDYNLKDFYKADSIFLTGTAAEIQPIKKVLNKNFNVNCELINFFKSQYEKLKISCPDKVSKI